MKGNLMPYKERLLRERRKWKRWQKAVSVMGALVVFCTAYALILPAVTMGKETYCGQEEHQHSEDCYLLVRRGVATPGNAIPVLPEDVRLSTPSDAQAAEPPEVVTATPSDAQAAELLGEAADTSADAQEAELPKIEAATPSNAQMSEHAEDEPELLPKDERPDSSGAESMIAADAEEADTPLATPANAKAIPTEPHKSEVKVARPRPHSDSNSSDWDDEEDTIDEDDTDLDEDEWFEEDTDLINDLEPEETEEELEDYIPYEQGIDYDEDLYELVRICGMEEHTHSLACYSNPEADLETEEDWLRTLPELTGNLPEDIVAVAESQVEYRESEKNYEVEGTDTIKGYTRYGQWYGNPYGDWNGMFASFCVNYAGGEDAPMDADGSLLAEKLRGTVPGLYKEQEEYEPSPGDLIFLSGENKGDSRVGIVKDVTRNEQGEVERVVAIEGDSHDKVGYQTYQAGSERIEGYGLMSRYGTNLMTIRTETENAVITAVYEEGALPERVQLKASEMPEDDARSVAMKEKLTVQGLSQGKVLTAMLPFDITFLSEDGEPVEPSGLIQISAEFKTPVKNENREGQSAERETEEKAEEEKSEEGVSEGGEQEEEKPEEKQTTGEETAESDGYLSVSANPVTRVGNGRDNSQREEGLSEDTNTGEEPAWEVYHIPEDGEPEKISGNETTRIEADEENALHEVTFQSQSSLQWAAAAFAARAAMSGPVTTYEELIRAINESGEAETVITLGGNIQITEADIRALKSLGEGEELPPAAVEIRGEGRKIILDLNGNELSLGEISSKTTYNLIGVYDGAKLTIKDSKEDSSRRPAESGEMGGLHYSDADPHQNQNNYGNEDDPWELAKRAVYEENGDQRYLEYYVTRPEVVDERKGETKEILEKYHIDNPGVITAINCGEGKRGTGVYVESSTLILQSGAIAGCQQAGVFSSGSSNIELAGGVICGNTISPGTWGGGVRLSGSTQATLSGSIISGNSVSGGSCGGGINVGNNTVLNMTGGYVTNNYADSNGGGIRVELQASAYLAGGYITNNLARRGGGIMKDSSGKLVIGKSREEYEDAKDKNKDSQYTLFISRNLANTDEGGGCLVEGAGGAEIYKGYITNNRTNTDQHWGGGGIFIADGSNAYVQNVLVTNNIAGGFGGGVTGCPTSRIYIAMEPGMAIYDNEGGDPENITEDPDDPNKIKHLSGSSSSKPQDHKYSYRNPIFMANGYDDFYCALTCDIDCKMLGGYLANWKGSANGVAVVEGTEGTLTSESNMGLTAHPNAIGKSAAEERAKLFINGNSSWTHAGGILCNGYMVAGAVEDVVVPDRMVVEAKKQLIKEDGTFVSESEWSEDYRFSFCVYNEKGVEIGRFQNDKTWEIDFNIMLGASAEGDYVYYIKEAEAANGGILMDTTVYKITIHFEKQDPVEIQIGNKTVRKHQYTIENVKVARRYDGKIDETEGSWQEMTAEWDKNTNEQGYDTLHLGGRDQAAFVNRLQTSTGLTVRKVWADGADKHEADSIQVELLQNGERYQAAGCDNPVALSSQNNWNYSWRNLPVSGDGTAYTYSVRELAVPSNYHSEVTVEQRAEQGYWIPVPEGQSLMLGKKYVFVNQAGDKALSVSKSDSNINADNKEVSSVNKGEGTLTIGGQEYDDWYRDREFTKYNIFTPVVPGDHTSGSDVYPGEGVLTLKNSGLDETWLTSEEHSGNTNWLKTVPQSQYASKYWFENGKVMSKDQYWWNPEKPQERVLVFQDGGYFGTVAKSESGGNTAKAYTYVEETGGSDNIYSIATITNTPSEDVLYQMHIKKISEKITQAVLPGARFQLWRKDGSEPLKFNFTSRGYGYPRKDSPDSAAEVTTELVTDQLGMLVLYDLPKGEYVLKETQAPTGYIPIADLLISLSEQDTVLKEIQIEEPVQELPQTGGNGIYWYTLGGMLIMAGSLVWGYRSRRKGERRVKR